jgi:FixJ family two-component response regulator
MYNNYNLFKYGKVLGKQDRMRAASTSGITRELAEKPAYCNYKERTKQNEKIRKSLERLTERRKELLEKVRKEQQKMMRNTFRR